jgi:hypothetical protein
MFYFFLFCSAKILLGPKSGNCGRYAENPWRSAESRWKIKATMKNMKKYSYFYIFVFMIFFISCEENIYEDTLDETSGKPSPEGMIKLGKQMDNPYSVINMQKAYDEIKTEGMLKSSQTDDVSMPVTHLYVRFLPKDFQEYTLLFDSLGLLLYDYPLDYVIEGEGDFYHDPSIPKDEITWLYTTVKSDFVFPYVKYEIIEECFIPEEDEGTLKSGGTSIWDLIEDRALQNAGYWDLAKDNEISEPILKDFSLRTPQGTIRVWDSTLNAYVPSRGVTVRCQLGVKIGYGLTDADGNYRVDKSFRAGPHYRLYFNNPGRHYIRNCFINIRESTSYGLGYHNKRGHNRNIQNSSRAFRHCTISNAAFDYYEWCTDNNIMLPHSNLVIWVTFFDSAAPMANKVWHPIGVNNNSGWNTFFLNLYMGPALNAAWYVTKIIGAQPDITIRDRASDIPSLEYYRTTVHELAHASHMRQVGSYFWSQYINYILTYAMGDNYGDASKKNSGYCGVGEMWGFYVGGLLANERYGHLFTEDNTRLPFEGDFWWFRPQIFRQFTGVKPRPIALNPRLADPLTEKQIFDCLTSDVISHAQLRNRLISNYGRQDEINAIFTSFGF